jgi:D-3-phosphoglycerate dehydrogenase
VAAEVELMLVLVLDPMGGEIDVEAGILGRWGHTLERLAETDPRRAEQLAVATAVLTTDAPVDVALLDSMPRCQVAATYGVGYDNIDVAAATARGVVVTNVPDYCTDEVADHTLALTLALWREVIAGDRMVRDGRWSLDPFLDVHRIRGRTLGLIGLGRIGRAVAERAKPFGFTVVASDPSLEPPPPDGVSAMDLGTLLERSDVISLHVPLTPQTRGLIGRLEIGRLKPGAMIVNTSRGGTLDLIAALAALEAGRLGGLALDVYPDEPPDPLLFTGRDRLVLTPHVAFYSPEAIAQGRRSAAETVGAVLAGRTVTNRVV